MDLRKEIEAAVNRCSAEQGSDTPDFILAGYLMGCLAAFDAAVRDRDGWYGRSGMSQAVDGVVPPTPAAP